MNSSENPELLPTESAIEKHTLPFISVIIPTYNDPDRLQLCLQRLENQTYPRHKYEIIVVDNGSINPIEESHLPANVILLLENRPGSYSARNKGLSMAKGEIIAFTDSDCLPTSNWIEMGVKHLLFSSDASIIGGHIQVFPQDPNKITLVELYESVAAFPQETFIQESHFSATANLFTFRHVIDEVGPFSEKLKSNGDMEWGQRAHARGFHTAYVADVIVKHPARHSLRELYNQATRIAGGTYDGRPANQPTFLGLDKETIIGFMPPINSIKRVWHDPRLTTRKQALQAAFVVIFVKYCKAWERLRLSLGGRSQR
jgi:glycosyltransferase involved in cell wall biosynthesis